MLYASVAPAMNHKSVGSQSRTSTQPMITLGCVSRPKPSAIASVKPAPLQTRCR
jgi:hypothetical protein